MRPFWKGFESKKAGVVPIKKHVIVLYWSPDFPDVKSRFDRTRMRYPTVKVKVIKTDSFRGISPTHNIKTLPTILVLKNGKEVDRVTGSAPSMTLLDQLFKKAGI